MPGQKFDEVKRYFREHNLNASNDWLEECVEWAMSNHAADEQSACKLQQFAYQQWLLADLREVGSSCLPTFAAQGVTQFNGKYTLQVEKCVDICNSMYSQLKLLRGGAVELDDQGDAAEGENNEELSEWGRGPSHSSAKLRPRKLLLSLCDGKVELKGLEYQPLPQLNGLIFPGIKVLISGPIVCRRGVLLLESKHLQVLGGEIDTLLVPNAPENIMARSLGLPENPEPYKNVQHTVAEPRVVRTPNVAPSHITPQTHTNMEHRRGAVRTPNLAPPQVRPQTHNKGAIATEAACDDDMGDFELTEDDLLALEMSEQATTAKQMEWDEDYLDTNLDELESQLLAAGTSESSRPRVGSNTQHQNPINKVEGKKYQTAVMQCTKQNVQGSTHSTATVPCNNASSSPRLLTTGQVSEVPRLEPPYKKLKGQSDIRLFAVTPSKTQVKNTPNLSRFLLRQAAQESSFCKVSKQPYVYICQLKGATSKPRVAFVKACVVTILERLKAQAGEWNLKIKITDGSGYVNAQFSNEVLEDLIGFSVVQFEETKVAAKENPIMKEKLCELVQQLHHLKAKLIDLICVMKVKWEANTLPCVIQLKYLQREHVSALQAIWLGITKGRSKEPKLLWRPGSLCYY